MEINWFSRWQRPMLSSWISSITFIVWIAVACCITKCVIQCAICDSFVALVHWNVFQQTFAKHAHADKGWWEKKNVGVEFSMIWDDDDDRLIRLMFIYLLKFIVSVVVMENTNIYGDDRENNTGQGYRCKFIHKFYANVDNRSCGKRNMRWTNIEWIRYFSISISISNTEFPIYLCLPITHSRAVPKTRKLLYIAPSGSAGSLNIATDGAIYVWKIEFEMSKLNSSNDVDDAVMNTKWLNIIVPKRFQQHQRCTWPQLTLCPCKIAIPLRHQIPDPVT